MHSNRHGSARQLWQRSQFGLGNCTAKALHRKRRHHWCIKTPTHWSAHLLFHKLTRVAARGPAQPIELGDVEGIRQHQHCFSLRGGRCGRVQIGLRAGLGMLRPPATGSVGAFLPCTGVLACWELKVPVSGTEAASVPLPQWQLKQPPPPCPSGNQSSLPPSLLPLLSWL